MAGLKSKFLIVIILFTSLQYSCKKEKKDEAVIDNKVPIKEVEISTLKNKSNEKDISFQETLISLQIINKSAKDFYSQYGIYSSSGCYSCDLAVFHIDSKKKKIYVTNNCLKEMEISEETKNNYTTISFSNISEENNLIKITSNSFELSLIENKEYNYYKVKFSDSFLKFIPDGLNLTDIMTLKSDLSKFQIEDCGDFDG
jgi:hypothetical protein